MADLTLPTPNKTPGDGSPADDTNLIIEAINTLNSSVENLPTMLAGGSSGYVLAKASNADYDTEWIPSGAAPPVSSVDGRTGVVTLSDLYDPAGAATAAQSAAEDYADGLAVNYDPAGSSSSVAGDLTTHEGLTTSVHGISDTANLVYTSDSRLSDARTPTDGSVTTAKIVDANVTNAKLENDSITINGSAVALGGSVSISGLPTQSGNAGKYLTTDGSDASWASISGGAIDPTPTVFFLGGM